MLKANADIINLQEALDSISHWSAKWQMPISIKKCSAIVYVYGNRTVCVPTCQLCGICVNYTNEVKDLWGVVMDSALKFNAHIDGIVAKANSRAYYAALLPRRGPHIASHSVCPSVRVSIRPVIVAIGNVFSTTASVTSRITMTHMYFSARTEGRISYGHLGRTSLFRF